MPRYDVENLLGDLEKIVRAALNPKIAYLNAEKNDGVICDPLDMSKIFFQDMSTGDAAATNFFLLYGVGDPVTDGVGPSTALTLEFFFILVLQETADGDNYTRRLLRYMRAISEIFQDNYASIPQVSRLNVSSLSPVSFEAEGAGNFKAVGVKVRTSLS